MSHLSKAKNQYVKRLLQIYYKWHRQLTFSINENFDYRVSEFF